MDEATIYTSEKVSKHNVRIWVHKVQIERLVLHRLWQVSRSLFLPRANNQCTHVHRHAGKLCLSTTTRLLTKHSITAGWCSSAQDLLCKGVFGWKRPRTLDMPRWAHTVVSKVTRHYTMWFCERPEAYKTQVSSIEQLKAKIREAFRNIFNEMRQNVWPNLEHQHWLPSS